MAVSRWRLLRLWTIEAAGIIHEQHRQADSTTNEDPPTRTMLALRSLAQHPHSQETLSRYEVRYDRQYHRAADRLIRLKTQREEKQQRSQFSAQNKEAAE